MQLATFSPTSTTGMDTRDQQLAHEIQGVVTAADRGSARSQQKAIGPSEIGHPCARRIAYRITGAETVNSGGDPWPAIVGTASHAWLAEAFARHNEVLGYQRWHIEQRVTIRASLSGSCDLFDTDTGTVVDHKLVGVQAMRDYKRDGPSAVYRAQAHLYGMGFANAGYQVNRVSIGFFPRGGMLGGLHVWSEPYDPQRAQVALDRHDRILEAALALRVDEYPAHYRELPREPSHGCQWCPWWQPGPDTGEACPGHLE